MGAVYFLGRLHVVALHLPIALVIAVLAFEWLACKERYRQMEPAVPALWAAGSSSSAQGRRGGLMLPARYSPYAYAFFRIVFGFLFMLHGMQKLFGLFGGRVADDPLRVAAGIIEAVGGGLILTGLFVRPVAFLAAGEMAVAYFLSHAPRGFWPLENGGELAALYCFAFLYMATRGADIWSADSLRMR